MAKRSVKDLFAFKWFFKVTCDITADRLSPRAPRRRSSFFLLQMK